MTIRDKAADLDFTNVSMESLYDIVDKMEFSGGSEAAAIYDGMKAMNAGFSFSDYLKRYIYRKAGLEGAWREIPDSDYAAIILNSFEDNACPLSFERTTTKRTVMARSWLRQNSVSRHVVLMLGFGLKMSEDDVNDFLTRAIRDPALNPKDPLEAVCWYCYRNGLGFSAFRRIYGALPEDAENGGGLPRPDENTAGFRKVMYDIRSEDELRRYISSLRAASGELRYGVTALREFNKLYNNVRGFRNMTSDIELEKLLYDPVPRDINGNLVPVKDSSLSGIFSEKRLTRQRLNQIRAGKTQVSRFDLITMNFLVYGGMTEALPKRRYIDFVNSTNAILKKCGMGELYAANPYEAFLMICMLAESPVDVCAEVWGMSYEREGEE